MRKKREILWQLLFAFMKIGSVTFGGGYAMIPIIHEICVEQKHWISDDEMMNMTVIAESTPGPIAINAATYVGYKKAGILGSVIATFGIVLPSSVLIYIISLSLANFIDFPIVAKAFSGIKIAVGLLILDAAVMMIKKMPKKTFSIVVMISSFISLFTFPISSIQLIILSVMISLASFVISGKREKGRDCKE